MMVGAFALALCGSLIDVSEARAQALPDNLLCWAGEAPDTMRAKAAVLEARGDGLSRAFANSCRALADRDESQERIQAILEDGRRRMQQLEDERAGREEMRKQYLRVHDCRFDHECTPEKLADRSLQRCSAEVKELPYGPEMYRKLADCKVAAANTNKDPDAKADPEIAEKLRRYARHDREEAVRVEAQQAMARKPGVSIGMTAAQVTNDTSWGRPDHVNRTV
jgi:hypothetical protein